ncbi:hypothetical protein KM043_007773 [Ampulex compressa]|nr:hypothetical protein KM043_007773 [Ampulex compressa]
MERNPRRVPLVQVHSEGFQKIVENAKNEDQWCTHFAGRREIRLTSSFVLLIVWLCHVKAEEFKIDGMESSKIDDAEATESTMVATTMQTYRRPRYYRRGYHEMQDDAHYQDEDDHDHDHDHDHDMREDDQQNMKAMAQGKTDYWGGYYDFLINEGSYKFWAVFQLATAALLIYSGFAALYYAKVNPPTSDDDFDDIFRRRRKRHSSPISGEMPFSGLDCVTFQRILDAVAREMH